MPVLSLVELSQAKLAQNYALLSDTGHAPYRILERTLLRLNPEQLLKIESKNPYLVLETEPCWYQLVKRIFPLNVDEKYVTDLKEIEDYFSSIVGANVGIPNVIQSKVNGIKRYKVPSRMLYSIYDEEVKRKKEMSTARLRQQMAVLKQAQPEIVQLDGCFVDAKKRHWSMEPRRSKLFEKSLSEHKVHNRIFRDLKRHKTAVASPPSRSSTPSVPVAEPVMLLQPESPATPRQASPTASSDRSPPPKHRPPRPLSSTSIFIKKKRLDLPKPTKPLPTDNVTKAPIQNGSKKPSVFSTTKRPGPRKTRIYIHTD